MSNRMTFNEVSETYDQYRPTYCSELFNMIARYSDLDKSKSALEVGMGTGQATRSLLKTGCKVTAIELGSDLVAFSREKFMDDSNLSIVCDNFESYELKEDFYDLVYAATAFHWVDDTIGYSKAYRILKPGGSIALFWNRPSIERGYEALESALQSIYHQYKFKKASSGESDDLKYERRRQLLSDHGFEDRRFELFYGSRSFNALAYIDLLNTYSDHITFEPHLKAQFEDEIMGVINEWGGRIYLRDTIELYMGRKPN